MADEKKAKKSRKPLTEEQKAARLEKRTERKAARAAKNATYEVAFNQAKESFPQVFSAIDAVRSGLTGVKTALETVPAENRPTVQMVVVQVLKGVLRPSRIARAEEKLRKRLAKLEVQRAKILAELG